MSEPFVLILCSTLVKSESGSEVIKSVLIYNPPLAFRVFLLLIIITMLKFVKLDFTNMNIVFLSV